MNKMNFNYKFKDPNLFKRSLTHKSFDNSYNNEKLENLLHIDNTEK